MTTRTLSTALSTAGPLMFGLALGAALGVASLPAAAGGDIVYGQGLRQSFPASSVPVPAPVPVPDVASGFYLRLDASAGFNGTEKYRDSQPYLQDIRNDDGLTNFGRYGIGAGYHFSRWFRADVTFDGRSSTRSTARQDISYSYTGPTATGTPIQMRNTVSDQFRIKDYTALINGYLDLPVSPSFTPYVGAGVGVVIHDMEGRNAVLANVRCVDATNCDPAANGTTVANNTGYLGLDSLLAGSSGQQNSSQLATALMAGFSYKLSNYGSLDIGWRWLHLAGTSFNTPMTSIVGTGASTTATNSVNSKITIPDQDIQEIRVGYRFDIN